MHTLDTMDDATSSDIQVIIFERDKKHWILLRMTSCCADPNRIRSLKTDTLELPDCISNENFARTTFIYWLGFSIAWTMAGLGERDQRFCTRNEGPQTAFDVKAPCLL